LKTLKTPPLKLPTRYTPTGAVHSGGYGQVFICNDSNLDRKVAIKILKPGGDLSELLSEASSLPSIQSKNVVQVFDIINDSVRMGLVQEYVPGNDLSNFASSCGSVTEYLGVLYQIASGITDIHAAGKIHRDIKPNNIKFDSENIVKIFDFGLACDQTPPRMTTSGRGTDAFRAPELYSPNPVSVTSAVDTYAFGVTAWVLADDSKMPASFLEFPPQSKTLAPSFSTSKIKLPPELISIFDATLAVDPYVRPPMDAIATALSRRLLFGQHHGRFVDNGTVYSIVGVNKASRINVPTKGLIKIGYDGLKFSVNELAGDVFVNGMPAMLNQELPGSCVLCIGSPAQPHLRTYLPFDVSHPEVVL
jgi:eukaryotic-like serine/threonine-protein kinase